ncbi:MAG: NYN domain-containing protein [Methylococcaceae bacterium]|nr:NYN domain-containing protein [Methylococcaceae bacterium]
MEANNRIAVFIDAENVADWLKHDGVEFLAAELQDLGQIIIRRAYGVWSASQLFAYQAKLNKEGFELIHSYHPAAGKNSADIQMTVDVMETAWKINNINSFVLVTGDSDFSPLFRRLREMGKEVIGVGRNSTLSECVKSSCSRFIYTDEFLSEKKEEIIKAGQAKKADKIIEKTIELIRQILAKETEPLDISQLKQKLVSLNPLFHQEQLEFKNWLEFLQTISNITLIQKGNLWLVSVKTIEKLASEKSKKENALLNKYIKLIQKILKEEKEPLNISMLRMKLVALDASFSHEKLGFKRWIDFLQTIKDIELVNKGSVWTVTTQKNKLSQNLVQKYRKLLNTNNKHLLTCKTLKIVYMQVVLLKKLFLTEAIMNKEVVANLSKKNSTLSKTDINKCFHLFSCSGLIKYTSSKKIEIKKLPAQDFLLFIDDFLIVQLIELCKSANIEIKAIEIKKLTYSTISISEIEKIINS